MTPFERYAVVRALLEAELARPYEYGTADCFLLGCRMADALDPELGIARLYGGAYTTFLGAQRALRKRGFKSLESLFEAHLERCAPARAHPGDLAILGLADGDHVGVCDGNGFVTKTPSGPARFGYGHARAAFRTGAG